MSFWRKEDPELDEEGVVTRGGMWPSQRAWWNLPNFIKLFCAGYGCVAAETEIGGVPIAERDVSPIETLEGQAFSSSGYLKGQAELYRVSTLLGREVVVTLDHRFLTPHGWQRLGLLALEDVIGGSAYDRDPVDFQKLSNSKGCYSSDLHLHGEELRHVARRDLNNMSLSLQPSIFHLYNLFCHHPKIDSFLEELHQLHVYDEAHSKTLTPSVLFLLNSLLLLQSQGLSFPDGIEGLLDSTSGEPCDYDSEEAACHSFPEMVGVSYQNVIPVWDRIVNIQFEKFGDYYDLSVPGPNHYLAHGLWHHNSGKTLIGCKRMISVALENSGVPNLFISPSYKMAKRTVIPLLENLLEGKKQLIPNREFDYAHHRADHEFIIKYHKRKGIIWVVSGDEPNSLKGPNIGTAMIDEPFIQSRETFDQAMARIRDPKAKVRELTLLGCVTRDSMVLPETGMCEIGGFDPGLEPKEYSPLNLGIFGLDSSLHQSSQFYANGVSTTIKLTTHIGSAVEGTPNQQLWAMLESGEMGWRRLDEMQEGDYVAVARDMNIWPDEIDFIYDAPMTCDLAWLLGHWIAEGSYDPTGTPRISIVCPDTFQWLLDGGIYDGHKWNKCGGYAVRTSNPLYISIMEELGMPLGYKSPDRWLPDFVFKLSKELALHFIAGMWDGDGHVGKDGLSFGYSTSSHKLASQLQYLLLNLGIVSSITRRTSEEHYLAERDSYIAESVGYIVKVSQNNAAKLAKILPLRTRKREALGLYCHEAKRDSDMVPWQAQHVRASWQKREKQRWRGGNSGKLEPNKIVESAGLAQHGRLSRTSLKSFLDMWEKHEGELCSELKLVEKNLKDNYYWARVTSIEESQNDTVDFCIPETHSFWCNGFIAKNSPEQLNWGYDIAEGEEAQNFDLGMVVGSTLENKALPPEYVKRLLSAYNDKQAQAFVHGKFINLATGIVYYGFDESLKQDMRDPDNTLELAAGMDFNVDPMATVAAEIRPGPHLHIVKVYELENADTETMCSVLTDDWGVRLHNICPDASGRSRSTKAPGGRSDFYFIRKAGYNLRVGSENPKIRDRENSVNVAMQRGQLTFDTNGPGVQRLLHYFRQYSHENRDKQDGRRMSHVLDALGYLIWQYLPVGKPELVLQRFGGLGVDRVLPFNPHTARRRPGIVQKAVVRMT